MALGCTLYITMHNVSEHSFYWAWLGTSSYSPEIDGNALLVQFVCKPINILIQWWMCFFVSLYQNVCKAQIGWKNCICCLMGCESIIGSHYFHAVSCPLSHDPPRGWGQGPCSCKWHRRIKCSSLFKVEKKKKEHIKPISPP